MDIFCALFALHDNTKPHDALCYSSAHLASSRAFFRVEGDYVLSVPHKGNGNMIGPGHPGCGQFPLCLRLWAFCMV